MAGQRRNRRVAMDPAEIDDFLEDQRVCRMATVGRGGVPHVSPVWFVWDGTAVWIWSLADSRRWRSAVAHPRVSLVVDSGVAYDELRGVQLSGSVETVGADPLAHPHLVAGRPPDVLFGEKYLDGRPVLPDGRHAWMRLAPDEVVSWDFRKMAAAGSKVPA